MSFKMITLLLAVSMVSASLGVRAQEKVDFAKESSSQLLYNFGRVKEGVEASHTFKILNGSLLTWEIKSIRPSCGCTTAKLIDEKEGENKNISSGQTFQIEVKIDTAGYNGSMEQFVYVNIGQESESKILKLVMEGEVIQDEK